MGAIKEEDVKKAVVDAWDIVVEGVAKDVSLSKKNDKYEIESRTKIKSLVLGLREQEYPRDAVLHFTKYAEYMLPRSNLNKSLEILLIKIGNIRADCGDDYDRAVERIKYTLGYLSWSIDGYCNILSVTGDDYKMHTKKMLDTEMKLAGQTEDEVKKYLQKLVEWKERSERSVHRR